MIAQEIIARRDRRIAADDRKSRQYVPRASSIGDCAREIFHSIVNGDQRPSPDVHLLQRFGRGNDVERIVVRELLLDGWDVVETQIPLEIREDYGGESIVICTGHIDGVLVKDDERAVFDVKSLNPNVFGRVDTVADFVRMGGFWAKYPRQLLLYMYAKDEPHGFYLIDDCLGHWKILEMDLEDYMPECEEALQIARRAAIAVKVCEPPPYHDDPTICKDCWCRQAGVCMPPMFTPGVIKDMQSAKMEGMLLEADELDDGRRKWKRITDTVKDTMKEIGPGDYVCGVYAIGVVVKGGKTYVTWERITVGDTNSDKQEGGAS